MQCDKGRKCVILEKFWREVAFVQKVGLLVASTSAGQRGPGMAGGPWELRPRNHQLPGPDGIGWQLAQALSYVAWLNLKMFYSKILEEKIVKLLLYM